MHQRSTLSGEQIFAYGISDESNLSNPNNPNNSTTSTTNTIDVLFDIVVAC